MFLLWKLLTSVTMPLASDLALVLHLPLLKISFYSLHCHNYHRNSSSGRQLAPRQPSNKISAPTLILLEFPVSVSSRLTSVVPGVSITPQPGSMFSFLISGMLMGSLFLPLNFSNAALLASRCFAFEDKFVTQQTIRAIFKVFQHSVVAVRWSLLREPLRSSLRHRRPASLGFYIQVLPLLYVMASTDSAAATYAAEYPLLLHKHHL